MNRILQIILGVVIISHILQTLLLFASMPLMFQSLTTKQETDGALTWEHRTNLGGLTLSNSYEYDSVSGKGIFGRYAGMSNINHQFTMNGLPYVRTKDGELVKAKYLDTTSGLQVPVNNKTFYSLLITSLVLLLIYMVYLVYVAMELFRFVKQTGRQNFFSTENRARLRLFGSFMLVTAIGGYLIRSGTPWLLQIITGTSGYKPDSNPYNLVSFPSSLIAGLLMFIIADAFGKGQKLQTEQDLTI